MYRLEIKMIDHFSLLHAYQPDTPIAPGWHLWYNDGIRKHPDNVCETEFNDSVVFKLTTTVANFIVPMSLMVIIYYKIFREIKRRGNFGNMSSGSVSMCRKHRALNYGCKLGTNSSIRSTVDNLEQPCNSCPAAAEQPEVRTGLIGKLFRLTRLRQSMLANQPPALPQYYTVSLANSTVSINRTSDGGRPSPQFRDLRREHLR